MRDVFPERGFVPGNEVAFVLCASTLEGKDVFLEKMSLLCFDPQKERCAGKKMCSYHAMRRVPMSNGIPARRIYLVYMLSNVRSSLFESVFLLVCLLKCWSCELTGLIPFRWESFFLLVCLHKCWSCELTGLFPFRWESVFCLCACISVGHVNAYGAFFPLLGGVLYGCLALWLFYFRVRFGIDISNCPIFRNSFATHIDICLT